MFRVRLSAEMKMRRDGVFEQLNQKIAPEQKGERTHDGFCRVRASAALRPQSHSLRNDLDEDRREHETSAERDQILQQLRFAAIGAGRCQQKAAGKIGQRRQRPEREKRRDPSHLSLFRFRMKDSTATSRRLYLRRKGKTLTPGKKFFANAVLTIDRPEIRA